MALVQKFKEKPMREMFLVDPYCLKIKTLHWVSVTFNEVRRTITKREKIDTKIPHSCPPLRKRLYPVKEQLFNDKKKNRGKNGKKKKEEKKKLKQ